MQGFARRISSAVQEYNLWGCRAYSKEIWSVIPSPSAMRSNISIVTFFLPHAIAFRYCWLTPMRLASSSSVIFYCSGLSSSQILFLFSCLFFLNSRMIFMNAQKTKITSFLAAKVQKINKRCMVWVMHFRVLWEEKRKPRKQAIHGNSCLKRKNTDGIGDFWWILHFFYYTFMYNLLCSYTKV